MSKVGSILAEGACGLNYSVALRFTNVHMHMHIDTLWFCFIRYHSINQLLPFSESSNHSITEKKETILLLFLLLITKHLKSWYYVKITMSNYFIVKLIIYKITNYFIIHGFRSKERKEKNWEGKRKEKQIRVKKFLLV